MKLHRNVDLTEMIRIGRGLLVLDPQGQNKHKVETTMTYGKELELHTYYEVGKVYPFTVLYCYPAYKADGTQQPRYIIKDKRGDKHTFYCDCTRYKPNQTIHLKVREISYGGLKFESNVIERRATSFSG